MDRKRILVAATAAAAAVSIGLVALRLTGGNAEAEARALDDQRAGEIQDAASRPDPASPAPVTFTEPPPAADDGLLKRAN